MQRKCIDHKLGGREILSDTTGGTEIIQGGKKDPSNPGGFLFREEGVKKET